MMTLFVVCSLAVDMDDDVYDELSRQIGFTPQMDFGARADAMDVLSVLSGYSLDTAAAAVSKSSLVYLSIISQQTYLGCWTLNTELSKLLDLTLDQLQKSAPVKVPG